MSHAYARQTTYVLGDVQDDVRHLGGTNALPLAHFVNDLGRRILHALSNQKSKER